MHSNYTLRFPRTSREAFGYPVRFEGRAERLDLAVLIVALMALAFIAGMLVGAQS